MFVYPVMEVTYPELSLQSAYFRHFTRKSLIQECLFSGDLPRYHLLFHNHNDACDNSASQLRDCEREKRSGCNTSKGSKELCLLREYV